MHDPRTLPQALTEAACTDAGYVFVAGGLETRRSYAEIRETVQDELNRDRGQQQAHEAG